MDDNSLIINIEAIDDATEPLLGVADSAAEMAETVTAAALEANGALGSMQESMTALNEVMAVDSAEISDEALGIGVSFDEAAAIIEESVTGVDEAMLAMNEIAAEASAGAAVAMGEGGLGLSLSQLKAKLIEIGIVASIAFLTLKKEVQDATGDAAEWNATLAILNRELQNTGSSIPITELLQYTRTLQDSTLFQQQAVLDAEKIVFAHKDLQTGYQRTINLSADLATFMGTSLPQAANALAAALDNPQQGINRLGRQMGGPFSEAMVSAIEKTAKAGDIAAADALIFKTLEESIGGVAQAANDTAPLTKLGNELHTLNSDIGTDLNKSLGELVTKLIPVIQKIEEWAVAHPKLTSAILLGSLAFFGLVTALVAIGIAISAVITAVTAIGVVLSALTVGLIPALILAVTTLAFIWVTKWNDIKGGFEIVYNAITGWLTHLIQLAENLINKLETVGGGAIHSVGSGINNLLGHVGLPHFADGGIVNGPTLAMVGEAGPEAIIPLGMFGGQNNFSPLSALAGGGGINVYINGTIMSSDDQAKRLGDQIAKQINRQLKLASFR